MGKEDGLQEVGDATLGQISGEEQHHLEEEAIFFLD
jgi:hypothetical protein